MQQYTLIPAYVIHTRTYRETSLLIDVFSEQGLWRLVANGANRPKSPWRGILQSFIPLTISWSAKQDLGTLKQAEIKTHYPRLQGRYLISGLYANELIMRLLHVHVPTPDLFHAYQQCHQQLIKANATPLVPSILLTALRLFEKAILMALGKSPDFRFDCQTEDWIDPESNYLLLPDQGFTKVCDHREDRVFSGSTLLGFENGVFPDQTCLKQAKQLMRLLLTPLLGGYTLKSRSLLHTF